MNAEKHRYKNNVHDVKYGELLIKSKFLSAIFDVHLWIKGVLSFAFFSS